jgi:hypothetical protein
MHSGAGAFRLQRLFERLWYPPQAARAVAGLTQRSRRRLPSLLVSDAPTRLALESLEARLTPSSGVMGLGDVSIDAMGAADSAAEMDSNRIPAFAGPGENEIVEAPPPPASGENPRDEGVFVGPGDNCIVSIKPPRPDSVAAPPALPVFFGLKGGRTVAATPGAAGRFPSSAPSEVGQVAIAPIAHPLKVEIFAERGEHLDEGNGGRPVGGDRQRPRAGEDGSEFPEATSENSPRSEIHPRSAARPSGDGVRADAVLSDEFDVPIGGETGPPSVVHTLGESENGKRGTALQPRPSTPRPADPASGSPARPSVVEAGVEGVSESAADIAVLASTKAPPPFPRGISGSTLPGAAGSEIPE